jgi:hypothetical protein
LPAVAPREVSPATFAKYEVPLSRGRSIYLLAQYTLLIAAATALVFYAAQLPAWLLAGAALAVVLGLLAAGALMERRPWGAPLEAARLLASCALLAAWLL